METSLIGGAERSLLASDLGLSAFASLSALLLPQSDFVSHRLPVILSAGNYTKTRIFSSEHGMGYYIIVRSG